MWYATTAFASLTLLIPGAVSTSPGAMNTVSRFQGSGSRPQVNGNREQTNNFILDGVDIGARAVIGAGAVVRDAVPAGAVAVGVPARILTR